MAASASEIDFTNTQICHYFYLIRASENLASALCPLIITVSDVRFILMPDQFTKSQYQTAVKCRISKFICAIITAIVNKFYILLNIGHVLVPRLPSLIDIRRQSVLILQQNFRIHMMISIINCLLYHFMKYDAVTYRLTC